MTNNPNHLGPKGALLLREAQLLLANIDSTSGTLCESQLAGLRAAVSQAQDDRKAALVLIEQTVAPLTQSVLFTETYVASGGRRLRVRIESDAYDHQSTARISMLGLNDAKWNLIASIPFSRMRTPHRLYYLRDKDGVKAGYFMSDRDNLLCQAGALLGPKISPEVASC